MVELRMVVITNLKKLAKMLELPLRNNSRGGEERKMNKKKVMYGF